MAKRVTKKQRAEADDFHRTLVDLHRVRYGDWTDWEHNWMNNEVRRRPDYIYTEKERAILNELVEYSKSVTQYAGYTVPELIEMGWRYRFDLGYEDQLFVEELRAWGATTLKMRQVRRLAGICRLSWKLDETLRTDFHLDALEDEKEDA